MYRRAFLKSLPALLAGFSLPAKGKESTRRAGLDFADAPGCRSIDTTWEQGVDLFLVNEVGTIRFVDFRNPLFRGDYYAYALSLGPSEINCLDLVDTAQPNELGNRLQTLYNNYRRTLIEGMENTGNLVEHRKFKQLLSKMPDDAEAGWIVWMEADPVAAKEVFADAIFAYLDELPDFGDKCDWPPFESNDQTEAYKYFLQEEGSDLLDRLGVVLVNGESPNSSYFAAELRGAIEEANASARAAGIPIRFMREGQV